MDSSTRQLADSLVALIRQWESVGVAFSGGVDSSVVAKAAVLALGDHAAALVGVGPALAQIELQTAQQVADQIGIRLVQVTPDELSSTGYVANAGNRCYFCKTALYDVCRISAKREGLEVIANGTNADDLGDYRPGLKAAEEQAVRSPLVELGIGKNQVRDIARFWGLSTAEKPASPCLASRIAPGVEVTLERLSMIEQAESLIRVATGSDDLRVRFESGDLARVELPVHQLPHCLPFLLGQNLVERLKTLGFRRITLDLEGLQSGNLNALVPLEIAESAGR